MKPVFSLMFGLILAAAGTSALAADVNPNGFPSGEHYNLNIIGKKDSFACPGPEFDEYGNLSYGNVVYVPEYGASEIFIESGKGKAAASVLKLQATDPCSGFDGDGAVLQLPKNTNGYRVYARALGKPTDSPSSSLAGQLVMVQDEAGNDLLYLGLVTDGGFESPYNSFTRTKGKSRATDISGMFQWTGSVCYLSEPADGYQESLNYCCIDADLNGRPEDCVAPVIDSFTGLETCDAGFYDQTVYCKEYESEWVFNIAELVTYLWQGNNDGVKLLQVRFYPN